MMKIKYFLYARKSSESEDRQVQSVGDQVQRLQELAQELGLEIVQILTESKSAKQPNNRKVFEEMLERIEKGEANGILCWQLNRLSRNPVDSGKVQWMLQRGIIEELRTIDRVHRPDDNALLFSVESGTANQFILDLVKNTKRGLRCKVEKGWFPSRPPLGYINEPIKKIIVKDSKRFDLVRKMWDLMLTGKYSVEKVVDLANRKWGLTTNECGKKIGGKPLTYSIGYRIFHNPFYYGVFFYAGNLYQGKHEPMITSDEFEKVQEIISGSKNPKPRPHNNIFAYTGMIRCGSCGCMVTAETKTKRIVSTGCHKEYTYYRCTRRNKKKKCVNPPITLANLEKQIVEAIKMISIPVEFRNWALAIIKDENEKEIVDREQISKLNSEKQETLQRQLDNLTRLRYRDLISDEEFIKERKELQGEIQKARARLKETQHRADNWLEVTEKAFDFASKAQEAFKKGDLETKKDILKALGENFVLDKGKLEFDSSEWLEAISNHAQKVQKSKAWLELRSIPANKAKSMLGSSKNIEWGGQRELNPR